MAINVCLGRGETTTTTNTTTVAPTTMTTTTTIPAAPGSPAGVTATAADGRVDASWPAPAPGGPVTGYTATPFGTPGAPGTPTVTQTAQGTGPASASGTFAVQSWVPTAPTGAFRDRSGPSARTAARW